MSSESTADEKKTDVQISETATSASDPDPRDRNGWLRIATLIWGPQVELARVSSPDRERRFMVAMSRRNESGRGYSVVSLGEGASYADAVRRSKTSVEGRRLEGEHAKAAQMMQNAISAGSALEFADSVMNDTLKEAQDAGWSKADIEALKLKFTKAREYINDNGNSGAEGSSGEGKDDAGGRDDHEGADS